MLEKVTNYLKLIRVKHYLKNFLIFLPIIFSNNLFKVDYLVKVIFAFLALVFAFFILFSTVFLQNTLYIFTYRFKTI